MLVVLLEMAEFRLLMYTRYFLIPYALLGRSLSDYVDEVLANSEVKHCVRVRERYTYEERKEIVCQVVCKIGWSG